MIILKEKDYMEVKANSLIADYDREILVNLYQPIIGFTALALYFSLWTEADNQKLSSIIDHKTFMERMRINTSEFIDSRKMLEGIGLLKTYVLDSAKTPEVTIYHYEIYAPRSPKEFFGNVLFTGMLIKAIGEKSVNNMRLLYCLDKNMDSVTEISSSFIDAFRPDYNDPAFNVALGFNGEIIGRTWAKIKSEFSYEKFFASLKEKCQLTQESFTKKEIKEIERLSVLNGVNEETCAHCVAMTVNVNAKKGEKIDFEKLTKTLHDQDYFTFVSKNKKHQHTTGVSSDSDLAKKINLMENLSPNKYLSLLQGNTMAAPSDLALINDLSYKYQLTNNVINALIDYSLAKNNNVLSRSYVEKVAASLARENVKTAVDTMNYLNKVAKGRKKAKAQKEPIVEILEDNITLSNDAEHEDTQVENLDWDTLVNLIENGGTTNGEN